MKTVVSVITGILTVTAVIVSVSSDGYMSGNDWAAVITAIVGVLGGSAAVFSAPNKSIDTQKGNE